MQLITGELRPAQLQSTLADFDIRTTWFTFSRSLLAVAQLSVLLLTPYSALMQSLIGQGTGPHCDGVRAGAIYCLSAGAPAWIPTVAMAGVLVAFGLGIAPIWVGPLHAWVSFSVATTISLPDGGDQAAAVCSIFLLAVSAGDNRRWTGAPRLAPVPELRKQIALAGLMALRVQLAAIYFDSAISKLSVRDWASGTAEYYILRDPYFGASGLVGAVGRSLTDSSFVTVGATWGAIILEIVTGVLLLCGERSKRLALVLCVALHVTIIATIGIWSFGLIMIALVALAAQPARCDSTAVRANV